jgi:hypothetical protein
VISTLLTVFLILAVGTQVTDRLSVRLQEAVLAKLPTAQASAYYDLLRRRVLRIRIMRAITLLSLAVLLYAYKHRQTHY